MATISSQKPVDPWDQPSGSTSIRRAAPTAPVPDDWENDDDEDDDAETEQDNQRIWDNANMQAPNPMPSLIISPSSTSTRTILSPPPGAFQPAMRILKRPSNSGSNSPTPPPSTSQETLKEREARYQAARERIFGEDSGVTANASGSSTALSSKDRKSPALPQNTSSVAVVRNPRGPHEDTPGGASPRGFGQRMTKPPSSKEGPM